MAERSRVYQCVLCGFLSPSLDLNISHLRLVHSGDPHFHVQCNIDQCEEEFRSFSAYNSHVYRKHRIALGLERPAQESMDQSTGLLPDINDTPAEPETSEQQFSYIAESDLIRPSLGPSAYTERNAEFLMALTEGKHLSQSAIDEVIRGCRNIHDQAVAQYKEEAERKLEEAGIHPSVISNIEQCDPFENLESAYLRKKYYKEHFGYMVYTCIVLTYNYTIGMHACVPVYICVYISFGAYKHCSSLNIWYMYRNLKRFPLAHHTTHWSFLGQRDEISQRQTTFTTFQFWIH